MKYSYPVENFSTARYALMLPHPKGEAESIMRAFHECSIGLHNLDRAGLDANALRWVCKLEDLMNIDGLEDPSGRGLFIIKAELLSEGEEFELSHLVNDLAEWFNRASR